MTRLLTTLLMVLQRKCEGSSLVIVLRLASKTSLQQAVPMSVVHLIIGMSKTHKLSLAHLDNHRLLLPAPKASVATVKPSFVYCHHNIQPNTPFVVIKVDSNFMWEACLSRRHSCNRRRWLGGF